MNQPAKQEIQIMEPSNNSLTPMDMLNKAISQNANIEILEKLMGLQERWEKNQARKLFDEAVSAAKAEIKPIARNKKGHNDKYYVDFSAIANMVDPILPKHGLHYRFRSTQGENKINVTCVLGHKSGHYEETTLSGPADTTGNKNAIQAIGSTLTYLQRYSLVQMLGLAASDDDDGKAGGAGEAISAKQIEEMQALIVEVAADIQKFCKHMKVDKIEDIPANRFKSGMDALNAKKAKVNE